MPRSRREIRSLNDFLDVPEEELQACLAGLKDAIHRIKAHQAALLRDGHPEERIRFDAFTWEPLAKRRLEPGSIQGATPLKALALKPRVRHVLSLLNIYCLEDLTEISESELIREPSVGRTTVARLREALQAIGMDFKPNPNPVGAMYDRNRALGKIPVEQRANSLSDASHLSELGLRTTTLSRMLSRDITLVGDLRTQSLRSLNTHFGKAQVKEILSVLDRAGLPLINQPSQLDLWRSGLLSAGEVRIDTSRKGTVLNLAPWIGWACAKNLEAHGVRTVGELLKAAKSGELRKSKGVGKGTEARVKRTLSERGLLPQEETPAFSRPYSSGRR